MTELRTAINAARTRNGLAAVTWTDPTLAADYTDQTIVPGRTVSKAVHVLELRTAVNALP